MIDDLDREIIRHLQTDGRMPYSQLAQHIGLSDAATRQRVNRLTESGEALAGARTLAHELTELPPLCMRSDLRSTKDQWDLDLEAALAHEADLGLATIMSGETREGATRFAQGAGRHGEKA